MKPPLSAMISLRMLAALLGAGLSCSLSAQDFSRVAPKTPAAETQAPELPATPTTPAPASDAVLVDALRGLVFLTDRAALRAEGRDATGVVADNLPVLQTPEFEDIARRYLGRPVTLRLLNELSRDLVLHYRRNDRPVVDVLVPEQNIHNGVVQVLVLEGRLGQVKAEGNLHFSTEQLVRQVRLAPGEPIGGSALLADVSWLNQNPFRQVDLVFARGAQPGQTDVILRTRDRRPVRFFAGYEDSGNDATGDSRLIAGMNLGNAFGRDHQFNYQLTAAPDFSSLVAHSASYVLPLESSRRVLTVFGSHATSEPELPGGVFSLDGTSWQASARLAFAPISRNVNLTHQFTLGADFKRSNNNLEFGGFQVFANSTEIAQLVAGYNFTHNRPGVTLSGNAQLVWSPGGLTSGNESGRFRAARAMARADYAYLQFSLERRARLAGEWSLLNRFSGQVSSANLLGSEQLGLGGYINLRGYEEREANGDHGAVLVNELHLPPMTVGQFGRANGRLDPFAFLDAGVAASRDRLPGEPGSLTLASTGVGLNYSLGPTAQLRVAYGWQLRDSEVSDGRRNHRGHIGLVIAY